MELRDDTGQASIEHLGLIVLVALVLLAAGGIAAVAAPGLGNRVTTGMQRALCAVSGEACPTLDREPCPVLRTDRTMRTRASIGWLRLGDDRALSIERRSDGTYVIGLVEGIGAGAGVTYGRLGAEASADGLLSGRAGRTWTAPDRTTAAALVRRLRRRALPGAETLLRGAADLSGLADAEPGVESYTLAGKAAGDATAKLGFGSIVEAGADGDAGIEVGVRIAAHRREATAYVALDARVGAFFDALPAASLPRAGRGSPSRRGPRQSGGGPRPQRDDAESLGTLLNPNKLSQSAEAVTGGSVALRLAPGPRVLEVDVTAVVGTGAAARELHARIDPAQPDVAAALAAWRRHPTDAGALSALGRAAATGAAIDERRFAVASSSREYGGEVGIGPSLGLTAEQGLRTATLVEQRTRPVGGVWEQRLDCGVA